ncbi:MAG: hypothetical protein ACI9OF_001434, partial [Saprospiraceae bacterium]
ALKVDSLKGKGASSWLGGVSADTFGEGLLSGVGVKGSVDRTLFV